MLTSGTGQQDAGGDQFQLQPWRRGAGHLAQPGVDQVGRVRERPGTEPTRLHPHPLDLIARQRPQHRRPCVGHCGQDDQVAEALEQVLDEAPGVVAGLDDLVDLGEDPRGVSSPEGRDRRIQQFTVGEPEERSRSVIGQPTRVRPRHQLIEHGQRISHRTSAGPHDEGQHARLDIDTLGVAQELEIVVQPGRRHEAEGVVVGAGADGPDDLFGLGGREDELHVLGRLLDDLEQSVEALRRDHVGLVDDVDLVAALGRREGRPLPQLTGIVDAAVAGRVDLDDVDRAGPPARQRHARVALAARGAGRPLLAIETAGKDAGARRLAAPTGAGEEVGVIDAAGVQRTHQGHRHVLLPDHVGERVGPVAAIQSGAHPRNPSRGSRQRHPARLPVTRMCALDGPEVHSRPDGALRVGSVSG